MTIAARTFTTFAEGFALAYAEEISGETYFATFAKAEPDPRRAALWQKIALIETRTEAALRPLAAALGVLPADTLALRNEGRDEALANPAGPWAAAMTLITREYPAYLDEFAGLAALAPANAVKAVTLLYDHEVAMIDFARAELAKDPDAEAPLDAYLARVASWTWDGPDG